MNVNGEEPQRLLAIAIKDMDMLMARTLTLDNNVRPMKLGLTNKEMFNFIRNVALLNDKPFLQELLRYNSDLGGKVLWSVLNNIEVAKILVEAGAELAIGKKDAMIDYVTPDWVQDMPPIGQNLGREWFQNNRGQNWIPTIWYASKQSTFLHVLIESNDPRNLELADLMIRYKANINAIDENGYSVLKCAIKAGVSNDFIEKLLHNNIHCFGRNVVTIADCDRTDDLLPLIITTDAADENIRRDRASQALFCLINSHPDKIDVIEALFQYDVPIDVLDYKSDTVLHNAVINVEPNLIEFLLKRNADPNKSTSKGVQPLWIASTLKESTIVSLLIKYGADVNRPNDDGQRPIHGAYKGGSMNNIFLLTRLGADINAIDKKRLTPFSTLLERLLYINPETSVEDAFFIRQIALAAFGGVEFDASYMKLIESSPRLHKMYVLNFHELQRMQRIEADNGIPYYTFLTGTIERISRFTRREDLTNVFENSAMLRDLFPCYFCDLRNTYVFAKERENQVIAHERFLDEIITEIYQIALPYLAIQNIVNYLGVIDFHSRVLSNIIWE